MSCFLLGFSFFESELALLLFKLGLLELQFLLEVFLFLGEFCGFSVKSLFFCGKTFETVVFFSLGLFDCAANHFFFFFCLAV